MLHVLKKNPGASFGFMGAHTVDLANRIEEQRANTKRFKIYKYAIEGFFGVQHFTHFINETNSTYLLVNNKVSSVDELSEEAERMFLEIFPQLEGI